MQNQHRASHHPVTERRAEPRDAATVHELLTELADHERSRASVGVTADDWAGLLTNPRVRVLLAWLGEHPIGYVSAVRQLHLWSGREILALDDLYVRPRSRGGGVGHSLMTALGEQAAADGLMVIRWEMEPENRGAQRFYHGLGAALRAKVIATWSPQIQPSSVSSAARPDRE